jgi:hypothetical protein
MIRNLASFANASVKGAYHNAFFHKSSSPTASVGSWVDLSMGAGIPKYNAYVGGQATATPLVGVGNDGINIGRLSGESYINTLMVQGVSTSLAPAFVQFQDYLMHYPLIDGDSLDLQEMDNTLTLPRYTSGKEVMAMLVCTTPMSADAVVEVNYTNQSGVAGRISQSRIVATPNVGTIISSSDLSAVAGRKSPYIPLANGDSGIRSVESVTLLSGAGGFFALVLVKPLTHIQMLEFGVACEIVMPMQRAKPVKLEQGCYLNMIALVNNTAAIAPFRGQIDIFNQGE